MKNLKGNLKTMSEHKDYTYPDCSCLDSAYERKAIDEGMNNTPVFPENIKYLKERNKSVSTK